MTPLTKKVTSCSKTILQYPQKKRLKPGLSILPNTLTKPRTIFEFYQVIFLIN